MLMQPNPLIFDLMITQDRDRTLQASEQYEIQRALRELDELSHRHRKLARNANRRQLLKRHLRPVLRRA